MGSKFMILCAKYPYKGFWQHSYQTNSMVKFIIALVKSYRKYDIIDVNIRNIKGEDE